MSETKATNKQKKKNTNNFNCNYLNNSMLRRNSAIYDSNRYKKSKLFWSSKNYMKN